ncbi:restriction endonuclease subunit S [Mesorhizobium sp. 113-3-3]|uniref:restriction endonuclease subunit S n=1 Tax=Mesorhizobium sp. 113-3-3 TaxID=2744516 RepID=UPI001FD21736|nr:restriction endonuclease subunit S [Mesorhizobium sp. 113-3-3]
MYSISKHDGFVRSDQYFKKQVFSEDTSSYKVVLPGDFAYSPIHLDEGSIARASEEGLISPMYRVFEIDPDRCDGGYIARCLKSPKLISIYGSLGDGSVHRRRSVSFERFSDVEILLPPLPEQRRIAAILNKADALRRKRKRAIELLDSLAQSIFLEMFVSGEQKSWPAATVGSLSLNMRTGPFGSQLLHSEFVDNGIPVLGIDNAVTNEFRWAERRYITSRKYDELRRYTVLPRDVLITIMGTCGRCAVVPDDIPLAINTKHLCCITLDIGRCLPEFLHAAFLQHPSVLRQLGVEAKGAVMPGLNMGIIKGLSLPLPPIELQAEFVRLVRRLNIQRSLGIEAQSSMDSFFSSLQSRAFSGQF